MLTIARRLTLALALSVATSLLMAGAASAATATWTGGGSDAKFSTTGNWTGGTVPTNGDIVSFPVPPDIGGGTLSQSPVNDIGGLTTLGGIQVTGGAAGNTNLTLGNMTITGAISIGSGQSLQLSGTSDTITIASGVTIIAADKDASFSNYGVTALGANTVSLTCTDCNAKDTSTMFFNKITGTSASKVLTHRVELELDGTNADATYPGSFELESSVFTLLSNSLKPLGAASAPLKLTNSQLYIPTGGADLAVAKPLIISGNLFGISSNDPALTFTDAAIYPIESAGETIEFTGAVTLNSDIIVEPFEGSMKFSGALNGSYLLAAANVHQDTDRLIVAASPNTTLVPNGNYAFATNATLSDSQPSLDVLVVRDGVVSIDGARGRVIVSAGSTLKGHGTVGALNLLGTLAPGNSPGCIATGNVSMSSSATYSVEIQGATACSQYDKTNVTGTVSLGNAALSVDRLASYKPAAGTSFTIIDNDGADAVSGTFNGLAEGATFTTSGYVYKISYIGGTGNDVTLTVQGVPTGANTGFRLLLTNPLWVLLASVGVAAGLYVAGRYTSIFQR